MNKSRHTPPPEPSLLELIRADMKPALGVTEPGAIAFAVAKARSHVQGGVALVRLRLNSGMFKNAFTCGIPNSEQCGNAFAAALGAVGADPQAGLEALSAITPAHNQAAQALLDAGKVKVELSGVTPEIFIEATVQSECDCCTVTIEHGHTDITSIVLNGKEIFAAPETGGEKKDQSCADNPGVANGQGNLIRPDSATCRNKPDNPSCQNRTDSANSQIYPDTSGAAGNQDEHYRLNRPVQAAIHSFTLESILEFVNGANPEDLQFMMEAYTVNLALLQAALDSPRARIADLLYAENGNRLISVNELATAQLMCNGAIEGRVIGLDKAAMSITGSGAHGIICTMPLYAFCKVRDFSQEKLLRATALSYLITMYIKEYSGRLSAFCGCAIAAGTGMACALAWLRGAEYIQVCGVINNMASSITGMICDGGNQGCAMKGIIAVDAAFRSVDLAMSGVSIGCMHGINGCTPEETMRNMGYIASPGMTTTEGAILDILREKQRD